MSRIVQPLVECSLRASHARDLRACVARLVAASVGVSAAALAIACGGSTNDGPTGPGTGAGTGSGDAAVVTSVEWTSSTTGVTLAAGDTLRIAATVYDQHHVAMTSQAVHYTTADTTRLRVSAGGLLTGLAAGTTSVTASVGTVASAPLPVRVTTASGLVFADVATGFAHSCALTTAGVAYCWGDNSSGQLGTSVPTTCTTLIAGTLYPCSTRPVRVAGTLSFARIYAGSGHSCALTTAGAAYCWGLNSSGQLGTGDTVSSATPVPVRTSLTFAALSLGAGDTCGLTSGGVAYCWGAPTAGQLGLGGTLAFRNVLTPTAVVGGHAFVSLSAQFVTTCAATTAGSAYCWGSIWQTTTAGALDSTTISTVPVPVPGTSAFARVAVGVGTSCGLTAEGSVLCWGGNQRGMLGSRVGSTATPVPVAGAGYTDLVAGQNFVCATGSGAAVCWGDDTFGEVPGAADRCAAGSADLPCARTPQALPLQGVTKIGAGSTHACALTTAGDVYCWGNNSLGQLGSGTQSPSSVPAAIIAPGSS